MFYRKYRPQTWEDLDNVRIRETLGKAVLENNWSHAYLLLGSRGTGKTTTARLIAKTVNCQKRKKGEEPCNKCDSCLAITNSSSLDVIEIDAASNTGVEDIRDLREKVRLSPTISKYKVYIIDEVHMLSNAAFNALLKTLEEPPAHVIFVLATTDPQKLPDTIVSRCLVYDFGRSSEEEIKNKLKKIAAEERLKVSAEVLNAVVQKANGSHRDAQKIFEQLAASGANIDLERLDSLNLNSDEAYSKTIVLALIEHDKNKALEQVENYVKQNRKIKDLITLLITELRDLILSGDKKMEISDAGLLIKKLIEANSMLRDCPIQSLPLELIIVEWCGEPVVPTKAKEEIKKENPIDPPSAELETILSKWNGIVAATKPFNHSLNAFLRAAHPVKLDEGQLTIGVLYKFHKEKLEENKNRDILEKVISDIIGNKLEVKFELEVSKNGNV